MVTDEVVEKIEILKDLSPEQEAEAREKLEAWLLAWQRQAWGTMASHCQLPQSVAIQEPEMCVILEKRLGPNHLETFVIGEMTRGHSESFGTERIAFADFKVEAMIRGKRIGI